MAFECTLMEDPVVASDGHTYDRKDIQNWFKTHDISPHTNEPFEDKVLRPNIAIRKLVIAWREKHGLPIPSFAAPTKHLGAGGGGIAAPQILKPVALCALSKQPLMVFCMTCDKAICVSCALDPARCKSHDTRRLSSIISCVRDAHIAWLQLCAGRPQQLQAEFDRVDAAAEAAIESLTREVRQEQSELTAELQRACVGELEGKLQEQAQLLADVQIAAASPEAAIAGSEACRCLRAAVTRGPQAPDAGCGGGRFESVACSGFGAGLPRGSRLGRIIVVRSQPPAQTLALADDFQSSSLRSDVWAVVLQAGSYAASFQVGGGKLVFRRRAIIRTAARLRASSTCPITITGSITIEHSADFFQFFTRSNAVPSNPWSEVTDGIRFFIGNGSWSPDEGNTSLFISAKGGGCAQSASLSASTWQPRVGATYNYRIVDAGSRAQIYIDNSLLLTHSNLDASFAPGGYVSMYNRDTEHSQTSLGAIAISGRLWVDEL
jgi:hypothetical protein